MVIAVVPTPVAAVVAAVVFEVAAGKAVSVGPVAAAAFPSRDGISVVEAVAEVVVTPAAVAAIVDGVGRVAVALFDRCRHQRWQVRKPGLAKPEIRSSSWMPSFITTPKFRPFGQSGFVAVDGLSPD